MRYFLFFVVQCVAGVLGVLLAFVIGPLTERPVMRFFDWLDQRKL